MDPVWSPDGERIAAVGLGAGSASMAVVLDADGSRMLQVIKWLPSIDNLAWSPNGSYLAGTWRTAPQESERSGVFVIKSDGTDENSSGRWLVDVEPAGPHLGGAQRHGLLTWYSHGSARPDRVMKLFTSIVWSPDRVTIAFFHEAYGEAAERQIATRTRAAHEGIPVTLETIKKIAEDAG